MAKKKTKKQPTKPSIHEKLAALGPIGPIFPNPEEIKDIPKGMRGQPRRKTKTPFNDEYREKRRKRNRRAAWSRNGKTYRNSFSRPHNMHKRTDTEQDIAAA